MARLIPLKEILLLVLIGLQIQSLSANNTNTPNGNGSKKEPCPSADEGKKLFQGRDLDINGELKQMIDADNFINLSILTYQLFKTLSEGSLKNKDTQSWCRTWPLCSIAIRNYTFFMLNIYGPLSKCNDQFCSDVRGCIRANNLCPQDSDNLHIIPGFTRCVKAKYDFKYVNRTIPDGYQDVCSCAYCDQKNSDAFYYFFFENTENPGVYNYLRLDSNPFYWPDVDKSYETKIPNKLNKSQEVTLNYYSFPDSSKFAELFKPERPASDCWGGALEVARLPDYTDPPPTKGPPPKKN